MRRGDIWIAGVLLAVAAAIAIPRMSGEHEAAAAEKYAEITVDGEHYRTVALDGADQVIDIRSKHGHNALRISKGGIDMFDADCPDKLCIAMGHVTHIGERIVCLPNRVFVEIVGGQGDVTGDGFDAVVS
ncbi:NusG domain II-containing protein [Cohnella lubricantis]|uniref:NusG domain II-containing protein n=1 Tax=Cohnella lubricantis TaxID=2163172 RepID=A0A841TCJ7_9BACL|nr:NusG domain II-containing protein [Cohnella lubricantis]MBB6679193.1 NusG domain II-containing protein [Cohnella lubricantis]MBP2120676.1 hypothetical protein [Cohnella lubricantis]